MDDLQARTLFEKSVELQRSGDVAAALSALQLGLDQDASSAWGWAHQGRIMYEVLGQYETALSSFTRALQLDPGYAWALAHRGATYERLNRFAEAELDLATALELKPGYTWALAMLGRIYQMTERYDLAFQAVEQVVERNRELLPYWREERAMMRMLLRRHAEADEFFRIALEADPDDRFAHYNSTVNLVHWRGVDAAGGAIARLRARLMRTLEASTDKREVDRSVYELGGLAAMEGNLSEAFRRFREAVERELGLVALSPAKKRARVDMAWLHLRSHPEFIAIRAEHG